MPPAAGGHDAPRTPSTGKTVGGVRGLWRAAIRRWARKRPGDTVRKAGPTPARFRAQGRQRRSAAKDF